MIIMRCLFGHQMIFAILYHAIDFESSSILIHTNMLVILQLYTFDFLLMHFPHPLCQNISSNQSFFGRIILKNFPFLIVALFLVFFRNCSLVAIWQSIRLYYHCPVAINFLLGERISRTARVLFLTSSSILSNKVFTKLVRRCLGNQWSGKIIRIDRGNDGTASTTKVFASGFFWSFWLIS